MLVSEDHPFLILEQISLKTKYLLTNCFSVEVNRPYLTEAAWKTSTICFHHRNREERLFI